MDTVKSDGSTASYYELPEGATELQDLISYRDMNAQIGEIFRACYRYGQASHSDRLRDAKKMKFYAEAEIARIENLHNTVPMGRPVVPPSTSSTSLDDIYLYTSDPLPVRPQTGFINPYLRDKIPPQYDAMRNVYGLDKLTPPLPRRSMSHETPMEEFVAFVRGDN